MMKKRIFHKTLEEIEEEEEEEEEEEMSGNM